ncbi:hypothetical protein, partial [Methylobacterium sp. J-067]|uniref:hypothetical protein n=1 Tax=Methylobacterium sp. J-067 TaxID=2836648 RepID=UPI001FB97218
MLTPLDSAPTWLVMPDRPVDRDVTPVDRDAIELPAALRPVELEATELPAAVKPLDSEVTRLAAPDRPLDSTVPPVHLASLEPRAGRRTVQALGTDVRAAALTLVHV